MEDVVATVPRFLKVPIQMLTGDRDVVDPLSKRLNHLTTHFFGVYDGHGGSQGIDEQVEDLGNQNKYKTTQVL
ncbi:putative protein-serine/threonine phosphatase [Helianthus anomalus]